MHALTPQFEPPDYVEMEDGNASFRQRISELRKSPRVKVLVVLLKLGLGVAIVFWLVKSGRLDLSVYEPVLTRRRGWYLLAAFIAQATSITLLLGRWWLLLQAQGIPMSFFSALRLSYRGMFAGLFVPGIVGLDGMRVLHLRRHHSDDLAAGLASMLLDRAIGFLGLLFLVVGFGFFVVLRKTDQQSVVFLFGAVVALVTLAFLILLTCGFLPVSGMRILRRLKPLTRFVDAFAIYRDQHLALAMALGVSIIGHFLVSVAACFGLAALMLPVSVLAVAAVTPLIIVTRFVPITPLGLGVSDGAAEELYKVVGLSGGAENQMLLRVIWVFLLLLCGLTFFSTIRSTEDSAEIMVHGES